MTVALVRTIIADPYQFFEEHLVGDGVRTRYPLANAPVRENTIQVFVGGTEQTIVTDYTIDLQLGLLTFVAAPGDAVAIIPTYQFSLLSDDDIDAILGFNADNIRRSAADALDTIASSEALIQKRIELLDLKTDGPAVANALRQHARNLREMEADLAEEDDDLFDYAEMALDPFNRTKLWWKQHGQNWGEY